MRLAIAAFAARQRSRRGPPRVNHDRPTDLPAPPRAEQRPYSYERHGVTIEDPWHWLRDQAYPDGRRRGRARLSEGRERLFRSGDGAAPAAGRDPVPGDAAAASRRTTARSRSRTATGSTGGRSSPARNIATWYRKPVARRRRAADLRRARRGRGQGIFPARRDRGQPRRQLLPRPWSTTTARSGSSCAIRDLATGRTSRR